MSGRTVLFDFYNTLYAAAEWFELEVRGLPARLMDELASRGEAVSAADREAAVRMYRELRAEVHSSGVEVSAEAAAARLLDALGIAPPPDLTGLLLSLQREVYFPGRELPGAVECVQRLHREGYTLAVVSNALCEEFIRWSLDGSGLSGCFSGVFTSAGTGWYKSSPELYRSVLNHLGAEAAESVHVGDSYRFDVLGARAAGIRTVWRTDAESAPEADRVVRELAAVPEAVSALIGRPSDTSGGPGSAGR